VIGTALVAARRCSTLVLVHGGELYGAIEQAYPSTVPNRDVPIEEWTWTSGECILSVWFHEPSGEWIVLDDVYRNEEVAFRGGVSQARW
jgi:hypothetical protein